MDKTFEPVAAEQKKKNNVFAIVMGVVIALAFALSAVFNSIGWLTDLPRYLNNISFALTENATLGILIDTIIYPLFELLEIVVMALLMVYSAVLAIRKGKAVKGLFVAPFAVLAVGNLVCFLDTFLYLFNYLAGMYYRNAIGSVLSWVAYGGMFVAAFLAAICGLINKKVPSVILGVISAILIMLSSIIYLAGASAYGFYSFQSIWNVICTLLFNVALTVVVLFLRPRKKQ